MSEAVERISSANEPPAPAEAPQSQPNDDHHRRGGTSGPARWKLLFHPAVGAAIGFMAGVGIYSELHEKSIEFVLIALFMALGAYVLDEPAETLRGKHAESEGAGMERSLVPALEAGAVGIILKSAFDHSLDAAIGQSADNLAGVTALSTDGLTRAFVALVVIGLAVVCLMYWWMRRAKPRLWPARASGSLIGIISAAIVCLIGWALVKRFDLIDVLTQAGIDARWLWAAAGLVGIWFFGLGLTGGWAVDRGKSPSRTSDLVIHLAVFAGAYIVLLLFLSHLWKKLYADKVFEIASEGHLHKVMVPEFVDSWAWLPVAAVLFQIVGWLLVLHRNRETWDLHLGSGAAVAGSTPSRGGAAAAVLPAALGGAATGAAAIALDATAKPKQGVVLDFPAQGAGASSKEPVVDAETRAERAKELLLKPKGDRLWATVALIAVLVLGGLAYYFGTLRGDPLISINIARNLQEDSGLAGKDLKVVSDDRVVTLTGRVDNEAEHAKALHEVIAVRGVKQVIDQIQVAPPPPPAPAVDSNLNAVPSSAAPPAGVAPAAPAGPVINVGVPIGRSHSTSDSVAATPPKTAKPPAAENADKHHGFFGAIKKDAQKLAGAQKEAAAKQQAAQQNSATKPGGPGVTPADAGKKKGFFHFLKKDKKDKTMTPQ